MYRSPLRAAVVLWLVCSVPGRACAADAAVLDPDQPYTGALSNPVTYTIAFDLVFTPRYRTEKARVWMVKPPSFPGQAVEGYQAIPAPASDAPDPLYGNRLLCFEFDHPSGAQIVRQRYRVTSHEIRWNIDPAKVLPVERYPASFDRYLRSEQKVVVNDEIRAAARQIAGNAVNPFEKARKVILHVMDALTYGHDLCSLQASSLHALTKKHGHCSDYHGFSAALLRAVGVPARVAYGFNPIEKKKASPSHCKLEIYLAPYGWVSFDVSETDKLLTKLENDKGKSAAEKAAIRSRVLAHLFGGFKDNTWIRMAAGTDYPLVPAPVGRPPVIRTAYIECDGEALPDPDPSNPKNTLFAWHLLVDWQAGREVAFPWSSYQGL